MRKQVAVLSYFLLCLLPSLSAAQSTKCPPVIAFKRSGEYVNLSSSTTACFKSSLSAARKGYVKSGKVLCPAGTPAPVTTPKQTPTPGPTPTLVPAATQTPGPNSFELTGDDLAITQRFTVRNVPAVIDFSWICVFGCLTTLQVCQVLESGSAACTYLLAKEQPGTASQTFLLNTPGQYYLVIEAPRWTVSVEYS